MSKLSPGEYGIIERVGAIASAIRIRFLELGLIRGTVVRVVRFAPLGDPMEIAVRGSRLSIRREEAALIGIERTSAISPSLEHKIRT